MPERRFRWAVGSPGAPQACPWTLTVHGSEAVLTVRLPRGLWHLTFHESGWRHWRFSSAGALARAGGPVGTRDADEWQAPDPVDGIVTEFMEISPTSELRVPRRARMTDRVQWIPPAPSGEAVRVILARFVAGKPVAGAIWSQPLANGDTLAVIASSGPLNRKEAALLARTRTALAARAAVAASLPDPAGFEWGHAGDRSRFWLTVGVG
jgi:hypothetical protein